MKAFLTKRMALAGLSALLVSGCAAKPLPLPAQAGVFNFSGSYGLWVAVQDGKCRYWLTHVGVTAKELREGLRNHDVTKGIEILTDGNISARCTNQAQRAVQEAGFEHFRIRENTPGDRPAGPG
jgi:hypothetical protein